jgi:hypothetical protein
VIRFDGPKIVMENDNKRGTRLQNGIFIANREELEGLNQARSESLMMTTIKGSYVIANWE